MTERKAREAALSEEYKAVFASGGIPDGWEDARDPQFTAKKDWDGFVDFGNNRLIIKEAAGFRVSCRYGLVSGTFPHPWDAMAHIKIQDEVGRET